MRVMIIAVFLLAVAFAGCASKGKDGDGSDDLTSTSGPGTKSGTATGTKSSSATGTGSGNATNAAPTAQLSASTGPGSLQVNFTIDGSDADGDNLTWTLSFGDGSSNETGAAVPANVTHTFAAAGNYTATLQVSDGTSNATASVNVTLAAGSAASQSFEGEWSIGNVDAPGFASDEGCDAIEGMDGVFMALFDIDAATIGLPYTATIEATTTSTSIYAWEVKFLASDCGIIEGPYVNGSGPITGTVPAGAVHAWMSSDGGAGMTGTYTAG